MPDIYVPRNLGDSSSTCRKYLKVSSRIAWTFYIVVTGLCILSKLLGQFMSMWPLYSDVQVILKKV